MNRLERVQFWNNIAAGNAAETSTSTRATKRPGIWTSDAPLAVMTPASTHGTSEQKSQMCEVCKMTQECLWYDGVEGCYHLLEFDPNGLRIGQVVVNAKKQLEDCFGLYGQDLEKAMETVYLIDVDRLRRVTQNG